MGHISDKRSFVLVKLTAEKFHQRLTEVEACCEKLKSRLIEMEGRSRRNNVRVIGLPEGI